MSFASLAKFFGAVSFGLVAVSVILLVSPSPILSIEFTGGTLMEWNVPNGTKESLLQALQGFPSETPLTPTISTTKTGTFFVRVLTLRNEEHITLLQHVQTALQGTEELQYTTIGPTVGASLKRRAVWAIIVASVAIVLYLAVAFRKVPQQLSPWTFGIAAIVALLHDILITLGVFTLLSHSTSFQMDTLFVSALISIMGYSVSDTIVIFDRIRDTLLAEGKRSDIMTIASKSLRQCLSRTLNTGLGALIMLFALFFFGSESIRWFILALIAGTVIGTYSSFFVATPLLVLMKRKS